MNAQERLLERLRKAEQYLLALTQERMDHPAALHAWSCRDGIAEIERLDRHMERLGSDEIFPVDMPYKDQDDPILWREAQEDARIEYARTHRFEDKS